MVGREARREGLPLPWEMRMSQRCLKLLMRSPLKLMSLLTPKLKKPRKVNPTDEDFSSNSTDFKSQTYELMFLDRVRIDIKKECGILASLSNNPGPDATRNYIKFSNTC